MSKTWIAFMLPIVLLTGCDLREDLSVCGVLRLNLRFTNNEDRVDRLNSDVRDIRIYEFDSEGWLTEVIEPTASDIARGWIEIQNHPAGEFSFSVWGSSATDISTSGYLEVEMDNASASTYRDLWNDPETSIDDFYIMLDHITLPDPTVLGDAEPKLQNNFADLYHGSVSGVKIVSGDDQTVDFDLVRNSNVLQITVSGIQYLPTSNTRAVGNMPVDLFSVARNGRYKWNNEIDPNARLVRYEASSAKSLTSTELQVDIKVLRLDETRHADDPVLLHMTDPTTGEDLIEPLDVIDAISKQQAAAGQTLSQTYLDRVYEFPIRIELSHDLSARIFINEWELVTPGAEL